MSITKQIPHLRSRLMAGAALALVPLAGPLGQTADSVDISDSRNETVRTSNPDGSGPADVTITDQGEIIVDQGAAVIVDSDNLLTNEGTIRSEADSDGVGIDVLTDGDGLESGITNSGFIDLSPDINVTENIQGLIDFDEVNSVGPNFGIRLRGEGAFRGDILNETTGEIRVVGAGSVGIDLGAPVEGLVRNDGMVSVIGSGGTGIAVRDSLVGNLENTGTIAGNRTGGVTGILIEGPVTGGVLNLGTVATGMAATFDDDFDLVQERSGGPAIAVHADVTGGILNGPRTNGTGDTAGLLAGLQARGNSGVLVSSLGPSGPRGISIGAVGTGANAFAVINRANITASSVLRDLDVAAVRIEGAEVDGEIFQTVLEGGLSNQIVRDADGNIRGTGAISASAADGTATAISIGNFAIVPVIDNSGTISAVSNIFTLDEDFDRGFEEVGVGGDAIGIFIDELAEVPLIRNSGTIQAQGAGLESNVYGVLDLSGTVTEFINSGVISPALPANGTGRLVAVDLSPSTKDIVFENSGTISGTRGNSTIGASVLLGSGRDQVSIAGGTQIGLLDFGAGGGVLELTDGAVFSGRLEGDPVDLRVTDSFFGSQSADPLRIGNGQFLGSSTLQLGIFAGQNLDGVLIADGSVEIGSGVLVDPNFFVFPRTDAPVVLISAKTLDLGASLDDLNIDLQLSSVVFEQALELRSIGEREELVLNLRLKDAGEIGLSGRRAQIFDATTEVLRNDSDLGSAIANVGSVEVLADAIDQLTPEISDVPRYVAASGQNLAMSALTHRFASRRNINDAPIPEVPEQARPALEREIEQERKSWSFYAQEFGSLVDRDAEPEEDQFGYDGYSLGFMLGADKPMFGLDAVGASLVQSIADFGDELSADNQLEILTTQLNLYGTLSSGGFFADLVGNFSFHDIERKRTVSFENFTREVEADWTALQFGGSLNTGYRFTFGRYGLTLSGVVNYFRLEEDGYTEDAGGGLAFKVDDRTTSSLRAGGNVLFDATYVRDDEMLIRPSLKAGFLTELDDDEILTSARFVGGDKVVDLRTPVEADNTVLGSAGISVITRNLVLTVTYDGERTENFSSHTGSLSARLRF